MKTAPPTPDEAHRLAALREYRILDTLPEQSFDDLTSVASIICETPIALVSLVDENRQWFKSRVGIDAEETPRDLAFCAHAIHERSVLVVNDTLEDARFADNPLVTGDPKIRFYAGAPLVEPQGHALGTICVIDRVPRELSVEQSGALESLSRQVVAQLELRKRIHDLQQVGASLLDAREMAEDASRTKSRFLTHMSHELRTPLNSIIGFSNILLKDATTALGEKRANYVQRIATNGSHLLKLINNILDLSRIEAGKTELHRETFEVAELVRELVSQVEPLVAEGENELEVRISDAGTLSSDRTRLSQCLLNLLSNACKFTRNGQIRLVVSRGVLQGKESVRFEVADTGIGMDVEQQAQLFEEFAMASSRDRGHVEGTGLGLAITRRICRLLDGDIEVDSEPGKGSTFVISVPS